MKRLDKYEGVLIGAYARGPVEIYDQNGQMVQAQTYFAVRQQEQDFAPHKEYIGLYLRGAEHFGLPAEYLEFLGRVQKHAKSDNANEP